jgi:hypothetical protein
MHLDSYEFFFDKGYEECTFFSIGVKGVIKKRIEFQKMGKDLYGLSFGDPDPVHGQLNDKVITNNGDMQKVLVTVAKALMKFLEFNPQAVIMTTGSTPARTMLYQMNIKRYYPSINHLVEIKGFKNGRWKLLVAEKNYDAFSICLRERN